MIFFSRSTRTRVLLFGGLGNQLFQIAAGFALAKEDELVLDTSIIDLVKNPNWFNSFEELKEHHQVLFMRTSQPNILKLKMINFAIRISTYDLKNLRLPKIFDAFIRTYSILLQLCVFGGQKVFIGRGLGIQDFNLNALKGRVLIGYFQSYRLIHTKSENNVLENMRMLLGVSDSRETNSGAVAIQVRMGDYEKNSNIGVLGASYFRNALSIADDDFELQSAVVFSDDMERALNYLKGSTRLELRNGEDSSNGPLATLVAMSDYSYYIISNSTFAWWAASISSNTRKVIAPTPWFSGPNSPSDLIPSNWITVSRVG